LVYPTRVALEDPDERRREDYWDPGPTGHGCLGDGQAHLAVVGVATGAMLCRGCWT
jgi:hypothetical protein